MKARLAAVWLTCTALFLGSAAVVLFAVHAALPPVAQARFTEALESAGTTIGVVIVVLTVIAGFLANWLVHHYLKPIGRLTQATRLIASSNPAFRGEVEGPQELHELADAINFLARRHQESLEDAEARIALAMSYLEEEKSRLAALMSELAHGVVACSAEGRIVLYNQRAREMFSETANGREGPAARFIGLGRSVFSVISRDVIIHAFEQLRVRISRGERQPVISFLAMSSRARPLRCRMAPSPRQSAEEAQSPIPGFVLLLEEASQELALIERSIQSQEKLIERSRMGLTSIKTAAESLLHYRDLDARRREMFTKIISEEAERLTHELDGASRERSDIAHSRWYLEQVRASDLAALIQRRVEAHQGTRMHVEDIDTSVWLRADSFAMVQVFDYLVVRLRDECAVSEARIRVAQTGPHAHLDLIWNGARLDAVAALAWESGTVRGTHESGPVSVREVLRRHDGEFWYEYDQPTACSWFRVLLPVVAPEAPALVTVRVNSRPEFYDFDLYAEPGRLGHLEDRNLRELTYTVFDTETTGLGPSAGDEVVSIGAVRIVNGRLLAGEIFEQLIDPQRSVPPAAVRIHGIRPDMLDGQPTINVVLPAFYRFCEDTVLVGHNAAFDLRFFQLKQEQTGVLFRQPVLDTLLLSAVLHGASENHSLEALAARYGINVVGRHTAVGDAIVTAEIFLKMIPLLAGAGIHTLREAHDASQRTFHARIRY